MDELTKVKRDIYIWSGLIPNGFNKKNAKASLHFVKIEMLKKVEERYKDFEHAIDRLDID